MRLLTLKLYLRSGPHPWIIENVTNMTTEGGLLRITNRGDQGVLNQWFPLGEIFRIQELTRKEV